MASLKGDPASYTLSSLEDGMTGSCLCGSITVTVTQKDLFTKPNGHICHCVNCRKITGASAATLLMLPPENVELKDAKQSLKTYLDYDTGSGKPLSRSFCSNCGSTIGEFNSKDSGAKYSWLHLGIFPRIPEPEFELFTAHRQNWMKPVTDKAKQFRFCDELSSYQ